MGLSVEAEDNDLHKVMWLAGEDLLCWFDVDEVLFLFCLPFDQDRASVDPMQSQKCFAQEVEHSRTDWKGGDASVAALGCFIFFLSFFFQLKVNWWGSENGSSLNDGSHSLNLLGLIIIRWKFMRGLLRSAASSPVLHTESMNSGARSPFAPVLSNAKDTV